MKKYNLAIDLTRIIAVLLVISVHTFNYDAHNYVLSIFINTFALRLAVPFFFMVSGYFLFLKNTKAHYQKYLWHILKVYLGAIIIYLPVYLYLHLHNFQFTEFIKALVYSGIHYHLWFFPALILGCFLVFHLKDYRLTPYLFLGLYVIGSLNNVYGIFGGFDVRNGLFMAPIFIYLGYVLTTYQPKTNSYFYITLFLYFLEVNITYQLNLLNDRSTLFLMLPLVTFYLLAFLLKFKQTYHNQIVHALTLGVYIIHHLIYMILIRFSDNLLLVFILTTFISFLITYAYYYLKTRIKLFR